MRFSPNLAALLGFAILAAQSSQPQAQTTGDEVLAARCASCHPPQGGGDYRGIGQIRKTPEGWAMTMRRMASGYGAKISHDERLVLLRYLTATAGLAPSESKPYRYSLERRPGTQETPGEAVIARRCARCHSYARLALQRRDQAGWANIVRAHVGTWPTLRSQDIGTLGEWRRLLSHDTVTRLSAAWPFETPAWSAWKSHQTWNLSGFWRIAGYTPGKGSYSGRANIRRRDTDEYRVKYQLIYEDGTELQLSGKALLYTGYEWRSTLNAVGKTFEEVAVLSADGNELTGRWFETPGDEIGGDFRAVRMGLELPTILTVVPPFMKAGASTEVTLYGNDLAGTVSLGAGVIILKLKVSGPGRIVVEAAAERAAFTGARTVSVGTVSASGLFAIYRQVDFIRVTPTFAIARSRGGGPGGRRVRAQFEAVAYGFGADGRQGTADDLRIGVLPAIWSLRKFDGASETMNDVVSAGSIDARGLFTPKEDDPFASGNLWVEAVVDDFGAKFTGRARLVVTPQRLNENPIR